MKPGWFGKWLAWWRLLRSSPPRRNVHAVLPHTAPRRPSPAVFDQSPPGPVRPGAMTRLLCGRPGPIIWTGRGRWTSWFEPSYPRPGGTSHGQGTRVAFDQVMRHFVQGEGVEVDAARKAGRAAQPAASDRVDGQLAAIVERLDLEPIQRDYLSSRWLDQVRWMEGRARSCQRWYYGLRLGTITGGVVIPALVGLDIAGTVAVGVKWLVFGLGLLVALATSIDGFFRFGERWRHYRLTVELLKSEGWQFCSGPARTPRRLAPPRRIRPSRRRSRPCSAETLTPS
jgi:hypothetical protein